MTIRLLSQHRTWLLMTTWVWIQDVHIHDYVATRMESASHVTLHYMRIARHFLTAQARLEFTWWVKGQVRTISPLGIAMNGGCVRGLLLERREEIYDTAISKSSSSFWSSSICLDNWWWCCEGYTCGLAKHFCLLFHRSPCMEKKLRPQTIQKKYSRSASRDEVTLNTFPGYRPLI